MGNRFQKSKTEELPATESPQGQAMRSFAKQPDKHRKSKAKSKSPFSPVWIVGALTLTIAIAIITFTLISFKDHPGGELLDHSLQVAEDYFDESQTDASTPEITEDAPIQFTDTEVGNDLRSILTRHWEAMGGNNWLKVESIRLNGTIERDGQIVDICIVKKRPNQIRATVTLPIPGSEDEKLQVIRAHDGKTAWTATRMAGAPDMKREELPPEAAAELMADAGVLPPLISLWQEGAELELLGDEKENGNSAWHIRASKPESALSRIFYLDKQTYRLVGYDTLRADGTSTTTSFEGYATESDIILPIRNIIESPETGRSVLETQSIEVGIGIYREYFGIEQFETASTK